MVLENRLSFMPFGHRWRDVVVRQAEQVAGHLDSTEWSSADPQPHFRVLSPEGLHDVGIASWYRNEWIQARS